MAIVPIQQSALLTIHHPWVGVVLFLVAAVSGVMAGMTSIGGVFIIPALVYLVKMPVHTVAASMMLAHIFSGLTSACVFLHHGSVSVKQCAWSFLPAGLFAFLGSYVGTYIEAYVVEYLIVVLMMLSGVYALISTSRYFRVHDRERRLKGSEYHEDGEYEEEEEPLFAEGHENNGGGAAWSTDEEDVDMPVEGEKGLGGLNDNGNGRLKAAEGPEKEINGWKHTDSRGSTHANDLENYRIVKPPQVAGASSIIRGGGFTLMVLGAITGFGCSITGTAGPFIMTPLLFLFAVPVLPSIGLAQSVIFPLCVSATIGYIQFGKIDILVSVAVLLVYTPSIFIGSILAHHIDTLVLKRLCAVLLIIVGVLTITQLRLEKKPL